MTSKNTKLRWEKPLLTVLARSNPEEAVLITCKIALPGPGEMACAVSIMFSNRTYWNFLCQDPIIS